MFRRQSIYLFVYSLFCVACLSWNADGVVRTLKHTVFYLVSPIGFPPLSQMEKWGAFGRHMAALIRADWTLRRLEEERRLLRLDGLRSSALERENERLRALLDLTPLPRYDPLAARIWAADSSDLFHSVILRRGEKDRVAVSDPVVAVQGGREVLVGQVVEVFPKMCRVLLVTDSLSAVSAMAARTREQGAVEGQGSDLLVMDYLFPDSDVRAGDEILTAGLGHVFPEGILLGYVEQVEPASRQNFKRAALRPAVRLNRLAEVLILRRAAADSAASLPLPLPELLK